MENSDKWSNAKVQALLNLYTTEEIQHNSEGIKWRVIYITSWNIVMSFFIITAVNTYFCRGEMLKNLYRSFTPCRPTQHKVYFSAITLYVIAYVHLFLKYHSDPEMISVLETATESSLVLWFWFNGRCPYDQDHCLQCLQPPVGSHNPPK